MYITKVRVNVKLGRRKCLLSVEVQGLGSKAVDILIVIWRDGFWVLKTGRKVCWRVGVSAVIKRLFEKQKSWRVLDRKAQLRCSIVSQSRPSKSVAGAETGYGTAAEVRSGQGRGLMVCFLRLQ